MTTKATRWKLAAAAILGTLAALWHRETVKRERQLAAMRTEERLKREREAA